MRNRNIIRKIIAKGWKPFILERPKGIPIDAPKVEHLEFVAVPFPVKEYTLEQLKQIEASHKRAANSKLRFP